MAFCKICGGVLHRTDEFCRTCGTQPEASAWDGGALDAVVHVVGASLIAMLTGGIATPWAICYLMRFVIGHAVLDGRRLVFDGTGGQLFDDWLKWLLLILLTWGLYSLWVIPKLYRWITDHTHVQD